MSASGHLNFFIKKSTDWRIVFLEMAMNPQLINKEKRQDWLSTAEERIRGLERRLQMLLEEQQALIVGAILLGDQED